MADLLAFETVSRTGGMAAAARELGTVPSAITARIKTLEHVVRSPLFVRHSRGVVLTESGRRLVPIAQRMRMLMEEARTVGHGNEPEGPLAIGAMETTAALRLPPLLAGFHRDHPAVVLSLRTGTTAELIEAVLARTIDVAFVAGPVRHADLDIMPAFEEELVLVTPSAVTGRGALAKFAETGIGALCFRTGCVYRQRLEETMVREGFSYLPRLEFGTLEGILGCVAAGIGLTLLPRAIVEQSAQRRDLAVHDIDPLVARTVTLAVTRRSGRSAPGIDAFLRAIKGPARRDDLSRSGSESPCASSSRL